MNQKRWVAGALCAALLAGSAPAALAAETPATRGEVSAMLLAAADDYNPGVTKTDVLRGDGDGQLHEERGVTRAEALVMLNRAFGGLPKPTGDNARAAYPASNFTDVPDWAKTELQAVFDAGVVAGTSATNFSPDEPVTREQMELLIRRAYALEGTNPRDDFYAAVNKDFLDSAEILPGRQMAGTLYSLMDESNADVAAIIREVAGSEKTYARGTESQKIADLYNTVLDWDARNALGVEPLRPYLEAVDAAQSVGDLMRLQQKLSDDLGTGLLLGFTLGGDPKDSTRYTLAFNGVFPSLGKSVYRDGGAQKDAYLKYINTLLTLGGYTEAEAAACADDFWRFESALSEAQLDRQEYGDIDKISNTFTMAELRALFPAADLDAVLAQSGLTAEERINVTDPGLLRAFAARFTDENLDELKAESRIILLSELGGFLSRDFLDAAQTYQQEFLGTEGNLTDEEYAAQIVQQLMPEYLGKLYVERHFSQKAKDDVTEMVRDIISIYKERVRALDWMSDTTKEKAIRKLDTMGVKIGYPDNWESFMDGVTIRGPKDGGSFFQNAVAYQKAIRAEYVRLQAEPVDKSKWGMYAYTVNAMYNPQANDITFPAGILQAPMYDVNASREQNLGAIGYVIAHEISHAFDNNGSKFDENGNASDWWTPEDYAAFRKLCDEAVSYYDGQEAIPGVVCNGTLTLSENIADLGAAACVTEAASRLDAPDYKTLYTSMARTWASAANRSYREYAAQMDVHAPDKLRGNRVLQSLDKFYEAFDIQPGDGMYLAPEARVRIW